MQLEPADPTGLTAPAGELWSTAEDLCRFAAFLLDGDDRVLPATTLAEADPSLLALTGLWYWGPRPYALLGSHTWQRAWPSVFPADSRQVAHIAAVKFPSKEL